MPPVFTDPLWGEIDATEPVLAELVRSAPVQRLRGVHQAGAGHYLFPKQRRCTRFEHSLGVMGLLTRLGAPLEERVAGLLHDVPHTAFSHTVDVLFPNEEHNYHERFHAAVVMASPIPAILEKHRIPLRAALEPAQYPLLEQPLPDLCADRIDYALRDALALGKIAGAAVGVRGEGLGVSVCLPTSSLTPNPSPLTPHEFASHLVPGSAPLAVDSAEVALWFALLYEQLNDELWTNRDDAGAYWALAGAIRRAFATGDMAEPDLFLDDRQAMRKLRGASNDAVVRAYLRLLVPGTRFYEVQGSGPYFTTHMKQRSVDPLVLEKGMSAPARLSSISPAYTQHLSRRPRGKSVRYRLWSDSIEQPGMVLTSTRV